MPELSINANGRVTTGSDLTASHPTTLNRSGRGRDPYRNRTGARVFSVAMRWLVRLAALFTAGILIFLVGYILVRGIPGNVLFGHNPSPDPGKENASCQIAQQNKTQIPKHTFFTS